MDQGGVFRGTGAPRRRRWSRRRPALCGRRRTWGEISEARRSDETKASQEPSRANSEAKSSEDLPRLCSDNEVLIRSGSTWCGTGAGATGAAKGSSCAWDDERKVKRARLVARANGDEGEQVEARVVGGQGAGAAAAASWRTSQAPTTRCSLMCANRRARSPGEEKALCVERRLHCE